jgi:integrase
MKFTKQSIAALSLPEGKSDAIYFDDSMPGFGIRIRAGGKTVWVAQCRVNGKTQRHTLGDTRRIDLDAARAAARKYFAAVTLGGDPAADKAQAKARAALLLGQNIERYLEIKKLVLRPSSYSATSRYLLRHFKPLHSLAIHSVKRRNVAVAVSDIVRKHGLASGGRARSALSAFFGWALKEGIADENPVIGTNNPSVELEARDRVLDAAELRAIWTACLDDNYGKALKLLLLTGCRRDEIGGLLWGEIDFDKAMLNLPGIRTKNHHPLNLPLAPLALEILRSVPRSEGRRFVFGPRGSGFSGWAYCKMQINARIVSATRRPLPEWRIHDMRRSVATHMAELGVEPWIVETILNHRSGHKSGVAGTYNRARYESQVRTAMLLWADHLRSIVEGGDTKVVTLRRESIPA